MIKQPIHKRPAIHSHHRPHHTAITNSFIKNAPRLLRLGLGRVEPPVVDPGGVDAVVVEVRPDEVAGRGNEVGAVVPQVIEVLWVVRYGFWWLGGGLGG